MDGSLTTAQLERLEREARRIDRECQEYVLSLINRR